MTGNSFSKDQTESVVVKCVEKKTNEGERRTKRQTERGRAREIEREREGEGERETKRERERKREGREEGRGLLCNELETHAGRSELRVADG